MAKVLIVDDAFVIREKLRIILKKAGHEVVGEAGNGLQATLMYKRLHPDIVTMDITMPGVNGIDGLKRIRAYDPEACVIVISAMSQKTMVLEALEEGATGFILKPFNNEKVLTVIEEAEAQLRSMNREQKK